MKWSSVLPFNTPSWQNHFPHVQTHLRFPQHRRAADYHSIYYRKHWGVPRGGRIGGEYRRRRFVEDSFVSHLCFFCFVLCTVVAVSLLDFYPKLIRCNEDTELLTIYCGQTLVQQRSSILDGKTSKDK